MTNKLAALLMAVTAASEAAIDYGGNPSACPSRPCVYTISCSGSPRQGVVKEIQAAVNDARRGDTIRLEAGCKWSHPTAGPAVWIDRTPPGETGRVTITTTEAAKLPEPGTRVTPAYRPVMPLLELTTGTGPFFAVASGFEGSALRTPGVPARHWEFRGLAFWIDTLATSSTNITSGFIRVGGSSVGHAKADNTFISLTVAGGVATATTTYHGLKAGDAIRIAGLTGEASPMNGVRTVTAAPTMTTLRFSAPSVPDGTYTEATMYFLFPAESQQLPDDIAIDQCLFQQSGLSRVRRPLFLNSAGTTISNSFISAGRDSGSDSQQILGLSGSGPLRITNNYIAGASSENIMLGGGRNTMPIPAFQDVRIEYNYLAHPPLESRTRTWKLLQSDGDVVLRGRVVRPTTKNGWYYIALNRGRIGSEEPAWCTAVGCTVNDGTVVWQRFDADGLCTWCIKNDLELKSGIDVFISHNVFEYMWAAGQARAINIKTDQLSAYPSGNNCVPTLTGTVNTNGTEVTADTGVFPWMISAQSTYGVDPKKIVIAGIDYTIASFDSATHLTLTSSAGNQRNVAFRYGSDPRQRLCIAGITKNVTLAHNIVRNTATPLVVYPGDNAVRHNSRDFTMRHNLFERTDPAVWTSEDGSRYHGTTSQLFFVPTVLGFVADHNTFLGSNVDWSIYADLSSSAYPGDTVFTNNIWGPTRYGFYRSTEHTGFAATMCRSATCPKQQFDRNIMIGTDIRSYAASPGLTANLCPSQAACASPDYGRLFSDFAGRKLDVKPGTAFSRKATDGGDYGADIAQLPEIRDLRVTTTDTQILFRYRVTQPIAHIPCVAEVSEFPDFTAYAGELSQMGMYFRQDSDAHDRFPRTPLDRTLVFGHTVPLSPGTTYYYRLHCGGDVRSGEVVTAVASGSGSERSVAVQGTEASPPVLRYGYAYSREADRITDEQVVAATCDTQGYCLMRYHTDAGRVAFWRIGQGNVHTEAVR